MSDAIARKSLARGLAVAAATVGFTGVGLALAMTGGVAANASAVHPAVAAASPLSVRTAGAQDNWPYFACASVGDWGICVGPPTN